MLNKEHTSSKFVIFEKYSNETAYAEYVRRMFDLCIMKQVAGHQNWQYFVDTRKVRNHVNNDVLFVYDMDVKVLCINDSHIVSHGKYSYGIIDKNRVMTILKNQFRNIFSLGNIEDEYTMEIFSMIPSRYMDKYRNEYRNEDLKNKQQEELLNWQEVAKTYVPFQ